MVLVSLLDSLNQRKKERPTKSSKFRSSVIPAAA